MDLIAQGTIPVAKVIWRPGHGGFAFTVVCKATFDLQPSVSPLAQQQEPVIEADEWTETGSLLRSTDLVPFKKRPEVLLVGDAYAPEGRPVTSVVTRLVVGDIDKSILVVGDRYVTADGRVGEPATFVRMPLVWERAVGGQDNPVGKPFGGAARTTSSEWALAPNLYPPGFELPRPGASIAPVGYAPISPLWPSRFGCLQQHAAGWDPQRWHERPLPSDIDLAYMNAAPADQQRSAAFADEVLYLENLHPDLARLSTRLAAVTPSATVDQGAGPEPLKLRCDTLVIDTNRGLAMLVWRGLVVMDRPDRPGRVVVTCPELSEPSTPAWMSDDFDSTTTMIPGITGRAPTALPFSKSASPSAFPPASSISSRREMNDRVAVGDGTHTLIPGLNVQNAPVLPFAGGPREQALTRAEPPPFKPPTDTPAPTGLAAWMQLGADSPTPSTRAVPLPSAPPAPSPPVMAPPVMAPPAVAPPVVAPPATTPQAIQETKRSPEPDSTEARLRLIQRAIWKGERPIQQILAEHGLTELEWRAAKRASARKSSV
ncbi:MAG: DUF2169 domain-containing protein [Polyangiaceae bacterium]|nr:DUF2169 domain-containing protein [Polyangiaceae bacterium]